MIITPSAFSFLFRNVNTSHAMASAILEEHATSDTDIIFFQELTQKHIRAAAHIDYIDSEPVIGLPSHPTWTCLPPPSKHSQVAIYIHQHIFKRYHFTVDKTIFGHPNIFAMFCYDDTTHVTYSYINIYANPNRDCPAILKNTITTLLSQLHCISNLQVLQGDFNLHCTYWDEASSDNPALAWDLIRALHDKQMSLLNDESVPTFYRHGQRPQVLDLIWINNAAFSWHDTEIIYDIKGPAVDHQTLTLCVGNNSSPSLTNDHLLRCYIPSGSEEEEHFIFAIFEAVPTWTDPNPAERATQFISSIKTAWD